ncbi:MAG: zinc-binding metallopeptidase family protein, partial [Planctomycetota bacterium]
MIKHKLLTSGLCLFFLTSAVLAQQAEEAAAQKVKPLLSEDIVRKIKAEGLENSKVMEHLDYITNTIGHRLTGSDNYNLAARWARDQFREWGLDAELEKWGEWPESWNRGQWMGRVVSPIKMDLQVATEAWTVGTKGRVKGPLLKLPRNVDDVEELGEALRGAYVLMGRAPMMLRMWRPSRALRAAVQYDIAGVVFQSQGDRTYPNRIRVFGNRGLRIPKVPYIVVRRDQYRKLVELVNKIDESNESDGNENDRNDEKAEKDEKDENKKEKSEAARSAESATVMVEFEIRNRSRNEKTPLYNVVAELKGSEKPDEYVVVCGHLDSWHQATG